MNAQDSRLLSYTDITNFVGRPIVMEKKSPYTATLRSFSTSSLTYYIEVSRDAGVSWEVVDTGSLAPNGIVDSELTLLQCDWFVRVRLSTRDEFGLRLDIVQKMTGDDGDFGSASAQYGESCSLSCETFCESGCESTCQFSVQI